MERPITLYRDDFENNTIVDPIITHFHGNVETPFASKDELVKQLPFLNKEFLSYTKFAQATITDLFSNNKLNEATQKKVFELETCGRVIDPKEIHELKNVCRGVGVHALSQEEHHFLSECRKISFQRKDQIIGELF